jgi:pre-mRNA cleavage complex 2 protein Pcf11
MPFANTSNRSRPDLVGLLYDSLPLQCSTCGRRFADTERDRKIRDAHLDWHFRVNKRLREDTRGQSRSWYLDEEVGTQYCGNFTFARVIVNIKIVLD